MALTLSSPFRALLAYMRGDDLKAPALMARAAARLAAAPAATPSQDVVVPRKTTPAS